MYLEILPWNVLCGWSVMYPFANCLPTWKFRLLNCTVGAFTVTEHQQSYCRKEERAAQRLFPSRNHLVCGLLCELNQVCAQAAWDEQAPLQITGHSSCSLCLVRRVGKVQDTLSKETRPSVYGPWSKLCCTGTSKCRAHGGECRLQRGGRGAADIGLGIWMLKGRRGERRLVDY